MKIKNTLSLFTWVCAVTAACAQGTLQITFDGPPVQPPGSGAVVTNYYESGMLFKTFPALAGFLRIGSNPPSALPDDGSAYMQKGTGPTTAVVFSFTNGSLFNLVAVDLAEYSTVVPDAVTAEFIGYRQNGATITNNFTTDGIIDGTGPLADFQTFYFTGCTDLARVEVYGAGWSLDNLILSVPEPANGMLLLIGGTLLWCMKRRKQSSQHPWPDKTRQAMLACDKTISQTE